MQSILDNIKGCKVTSVRREDTDALYLRFDYLYGLYILCYFRFITFEKVILSFGDMYHPSSQAIYQGSDDWMPPGHSLMDEMIEHKLKDLTVNEVKVSSKGNMIIGFCRDIFLEVHACNTVYDNEPSWRFFKREQYFDLITFYVPK